MHRNRSGEFTVLRRDPAMEQNLTRDAKSVEMHKAVSWR